jgi:hypothetical protein
VEYERDVANSSEATAGVYPSGGFTTTALGAHLALDYSGVSRMLESAREEGKTCPAWTGKAPSQDPLLDLGRSPVRGSAPAVWR